MGINDRSPKTRLVKQLNDPSHLVNPTNAQYFTCELNIAPFPKSTQYIKESQEDKRFACGACKCDYGNLGLSFEYAGKDIKHFLFIVSVGFCFASSSQNVLV